MKISTLFRSNQPDWSFQNKAISNIVKDFRNKIHGRYLLVLPTGGGKTKTAIRAVDEMLKQNLISSTDTVLWVVHTLALKSQAIGEIQNKRNYTDFSLSKELASIINVRMKSEAIEFLDSGSACKLIIIDEAHHAAASTYADLFQYPIGILGLTATPRRMDDRELPFEKVSFSITFRELVKKGVVLLPKFLPELDTNLTLDVDSISPQDEGRLESFNSPERNRLVASFIFREASKHNFNKAIVFVGTNNHVLSLHQTLSDLNRLEKNKFEHVGYIYGNNNNDKGLSNDDYLKWHKKQKSSILINCKLLNEGYDDPNIDAVVMGTPTSSILYYMQCIGRVVRTPSGTLDAKAYVIEIADRLPNVSYRIDNRWLFAEVSDYLEPIVRDIKSFWPITPLFVIASLFQQKAKLSDLSARTLANIFLGSRTNFILFNDEPLNKFGEWRVLPIGHGNEDFIEVFNDLSMNVESYTKFNPDFELQRKYPSIFNSRPFSDRAYRSSLYSALKKALVSKSRKEKVTSLVYLSVN